MSWSSFVTFLEVRFLVLILVLIQGPAGATGEKGARGGAGPPVSIFLAVVLFFTL